MTRDRDAAGRPRNARLRDALGRPLERADDAHLVVDAPARPPDEALVEAQRLLDSGQPFAAHEVLEAVWKAPSTSDPALWRGLAQLAVGLTHRARGNEAGARALLLRAAETLSPVAGEPFGVPVAQLREWASRAAADATQTATMPRLRSQAADERA